MQWRHTLSPRTKKFKISISVKNNTASVFWSRKGILLVDFMPPGATINAAAYCDRLTRLRRATQNKRRGILSRGVYLLHDNTRPHSVHITTALLEKFKWDILDHPPYNPDLTPSDFHLFLHLKKHLAGQKFGDDDEVQEEVTTWVKVLAADFYDSGIQLVPRLNKCLDSAGDYVEKLSYVQAIHSKCRFCKLKMLYMFKTFVSLLSGKVSYMLQRSTGGSLASVIFENYLLITSMSR